MNSHGRTLTLLQSCCHTITTPKLTQAITNHEHQTLSNWRSSIILYVIKCNLYLRVFGFGHYIISPILIPKTKAQLPACFIKNHAINAYEWGRREIALIVLNLGARLRPVVSFMARVPYLRGYMQWKLFRRRLYGPKYHSGYLVEGKNPFP